MLDTCEKWLGLVNSYVYSLHQTRAIYQVPYSVDSKLPGSFEIHWVRQYLLKVILFGIKDLQTSARTGKLKRNFYVGHVNIFPNLWHWHKIMVNYIEGQCYTSVSFTSCLDNKKKIYWYQFLLCRPNWPLSHWHSRGGAVFFKKNIQKIVSALTMKLFEGECHNTSFEKSTLVHVRTSYRQATNYNLNQCWLRPLSPNDVLGHDELKHMLPNNWNKHI